MTKGFITVTAMLVCGVACGQGMLTFNVNTDNLIYFTTSAGGMALGDGTATFVSPCSSDTVTVLGSTLASDGSIAALQGTPTFTAYLYGGTSSSSLTLQATTTIDNWSADGNPGGIVAVNATFNGSNGTASLPAGIPAYFQVLVSDNPSIPALGTADPTLAGNSWTLGYYTGASPVFQATPSTNGDYPIYEQSAPVNSTWAPGTFWQLTDLVDCGANGANNNGGSGQYGYGGIEVSCITCGPPPMLEEPQPVSTTTSLGENVSFTVCFLGNMPYSFQWLFNGTNVPVGGNMSVTSLLGRWMGRTVYQHTHDNRCNASRCGQLQRYLH